MNEDSGNRRPIMLEVITSSTVVTNKDKVDKKENEVTSEGTSATDKENTGSVTQHICFYVIILMSHLGSLGRVILGSVSCKNTETSCLKNYVIQPDVILILCLLSGHPITDEANCELVHLQNEQKEYLIRYVE